MHQGLYLLTDTLLAFLVPRTGHRIEGLCKNCRSILAAVRVSYDNPFSENMLSLTYAYAALLFGLPLPTLRACGLFKWPAGIQLSSYPCDDPDVTAGPSAPTTETCSAGLTGFLPVLERCARSPPLPPRFFWGKRVVIQVL